MAGRAHPREAARAQLASARPKIPPADTAAVETRSLDAARRLLATVEDARVALLEVAAANLAPARARRFREVAARSYDVTPVLVRVRRMRDAARAAEREAEDAEQASERVRPAPVRSAPAPVQTETLADSAVAEAETARLAAVRAEIARVEAAAADLLGGPVPGVVPVPARAETSDPVIPDPIALAALAVQLLEQGVPRELVLRIVGFGGSPSRPLTPTPAIVAVAAPAAVADASLPPAVTATTSSTPPDVTSSPASRPEIALTVVPDIAPAPASPEPGFPPAVAPSPPVVDTPTTEPQHAVLDVPASPTAAPDVAVALAVVPDVVLLDTHVVPAPAEPGRGGDDALQPAEPTTAADASEAPADVPAPATSEDTPLVERADPAARGAPSDAGTLAAWGLPAAAPPVRAPLTNAAPTLVPAEPPAAETRRRARLVPIGGASIPSEPARPATPEVRFQGTGPGAHEEPPGLRGLVPAVRFPGPDVPRQTARAEHGPGFVAGVRWGDLTEARAETTMSPVPGSDELTEPVVSLAGVAPVKVEYTLPERTETVTLRPVEVVRIKGAEAIVLPPVNDPVVTAGASSRVATDAPRAEADDIELDPWFDEAQAAPARPPVAEVLRVQEATLQVRLTAPSTVEAPSRRAPIAEARALAAEGRLDAAAAVWDTVLARAPDDVDGLVARGLLHLERSDFETAGADLHRARALAPDSVAPLYGLGDLAFAQKAYADAIEHYDAGLARIGSHGASDAMALCRRGLAHHYLRDWTRAVEDLEAARAADPDIPHVATFANMARARARGRG